MKACSYCGRENPCECSVCNECGSKLGSEAVRAAPQRKRHALSEEEELKFRSALKTGAGMVLLCSAILLVAARLFFKWQEISNGGPIGKPGIYGVGVLFAASVGLPLLVIFSFFTLAIFGHRFSLGAYGLCGAAFTVCTLFFVTTHRAFSFWLPCRLVGLLTGSLIGWIVGGAFQIAVGIWLLDWFKRKSHRSTMKVTS